MLRHSKSGLPEEPNFEVMFLNSKHSGFTLVELLLVMTLMAVLVGFSVPFVTSVQADASMNQVLRQVSVDLSGLFTGAQAGKSLAALSANALFDTSLIPKFYALTFEKNETFGDSKPYHYFELVGDDPSQLKNVYQKESALSNTSVYLKSISLLNSENQKMQEVDHATIFIQPPFGEVFFDDQILDENSVVDSKKISDPSFYDQIQLTFQYKEDEKNIRSIVFDRNKILNVY